MSIVVQVVVWGGLVAVVVDAVVGFFGTTGVDAASVVVAVLDSVAVFVEVVVAGVLFAVVVQPVGDFFCFRVYGRWYRRSRPRFP